jgi:hypothetical protein
MITRRISVHRAIRIVLWSAVQARPGYQPVLPNTIWWQRKILHLDCHVYFWRREANLCSMPSLACLSNESWPIYKSRIDRHRSLLWILPTSFPSTTEIRRNNIEHYNREAPSTPKASYINLSRCNFLITKFSSKKLKTYLLLILQQIGGVLYSFNT